MGKHKNQPKSLLSRNCPDLSGTSQEAKEANKNIEYLHNYLLSFSFCPWGGVCFLNLPVLGVFGYTAGTTGRVAKKRRF